LAYKGKQAGGNGSEGGNEIHGLKRRTKTKAKGKKLHGRRQGRSLFEMKNPRIINSKHARQNWEENGVVRWGA